MTVGELIKTLSTIDENTKVAFSFRELLPDNKWREREVNFVAIKGTLSDDNVPGVVFQGSSQILVEAN